MGFWDRRLSALWEPVPAGLEWFGLATLRGRGAWGFAAFPDRTVSGNEVMVAVNQGCKREKSRPKCGGAITLFRNVSRKVIQSVTFPARPGSRVRLRQRRLLQFRADQANFCHENDAGPCQ